MTTIDERARNRVLLVLFLGVLMAALDIAIVGPALPAIRAAFGVDDRALAWVFSIYVLLNLVGTPAIAKLSDMFGRRPVYVMSVGLFAAGSALVAVAPSYPALLLGRAVQGLGAGGIFPVASAVIGDTFPPEKRGGALGLIGAVFGIAFLVGPILGGVLLMLGWEWLFLVNLPLAAGVIVASLRLLPATRAAKRRPFDWAGTALLAAALAALAGGLSELGPALGGSTGGGLALPLLGLALLLLPAVWLAEQRAADPVLDPRLFRSRQVALVAVLAVGAGLSEAVTLFVPSLLVAAFGLTPSAASFMLLPMVLAMAVASPLSGRALDRSGSKVVVLAGAALLAAGLLLEGALASSMAAFWAFSALFGLGIGVLLGASLRYILLNETPPEDRTAAQGMLTIFLSVGQLAGAALIGAVAAASGGGVRGYGAALLMTGGVMLAMAVAGLALKGRAEELSTVRRNEGAAAA